jgi:hypothetical protein
LHPSIFIVLEHVNVAINQPIAYEIKSPAKETSNLLGERLFCDDFGDGREGSGIFRIAFYAPPRVR